MSVRVTQDQDVLRDVVHLLFEHLPPSKIVRFWAAWHSGAGDYLALRRQLFDEETVNTLFDQIQEYQASTDD